MENSRSIINIRIENAILFIRGQKVMLDSDLADIYGVKTKRLNEQVKRNPGRFPSDFMFQLTDIEKRRGGRKLRPPIQNPLFEYKSLCFY